MDIQAYQRLRHVKVVTWKIEIKRTVDTQSGGEATEEAEQLNTRDETIRIAHHGHGGRQEDDADKSSVSPAGARAKP